MKEIQLSKFGKNKGKYVALVDDEDFEYLNQFKWSANKIGNTFYAVRRIGIDCNRNMRYIHGTIMNGKGIDHIDGNGLNNQRNNLRFCNQSQNGGNSRKRGNCTSTYRGVSFYKKTKKWQANITINGKLIHLGYFVSEFAAAKAYNAKAIEFFCEFANLNMIPNND